MSRAKTKRLDLLLVERGLAGTREEAQRLIRAGKVFSESDRLDKPAARLPDEAELKVLGPARRYVSLGGEKLEVALDHFRLDVGGLSVLDVGSSTGGFVHLLLNRGARKVYALDVGYGLLAPPLRNDPRVVVIERVNVRHYRGEHLDERVDLVTADLAFISLTLVLDTLQGFVRPDGSILVLVKPQFEVGREEVEHRGVIRDPVKQRRAVDKIIEAGRRLGLEARGLCPVQLERRKNMEFFILFQRGRGPDQ